MHQNHEVYYTRIYSVVLPRTQLPFETLCLTIFISGATNKCQLQTVSHFWILRANGKKSVTHGREKQCAGHRLYWILCAEVIGVTHLESESSAWCLHGVWGMTGEEATGGLISVGIAAVGCLDSDPSSSALVLTGISSGCHKFESPYSTSSKHRS